MSQPRFTRLFARLDAALLLTLALCAFSLWPLLYRLGLPNGNDVLYHTFRAAEMSRSWEHGVPFPRWAESFYTGYGAPVFHYYASLSYYVTVVLMRLLNLDALNALRALIALAMLGSGAGMYWFARHASGRLGGVIAALAYVYSPYILFTEPYSRGAYPEMAAFALFPWVMALYGRLLQTGGAAAFGAAAFGSAALIITHNLMALVLTGLLVGWMLWSLLACGWRHRRAGMMPHLLALVAAASGVGLAAYFWLPVVLEGGEAHLNNLTAVSQLDYRNFFVPLDHLLAFSPRYDEGAANGLFHRFNLGVAQWLLALAGAVFTILALAVRRGFKTLGYPQKMVSSLKGLAQSRFLQPLQWAWFSGSQPALASGDAGRQYHSHALFFALAALAFIFLMLPEAGNVWGAARYLAFLQFPWRFLGPAAFCLAFLAGLNARWIERLPQRAGAAVAALLVLAIIGLALPALYAPEWTNTSVDTSVAAYHREELTGRQRATTFSNEYLPAAVKVEPGPTPRLLEDYADGYPVNKAHLEALPDGVTVVVLEHGPQHDVWRIAAPAPFTLEVLTFDFAGWAAAVDGQPVDITPSDPHGLITFPVPAGEHTVRLELGSTPPRALGNAISLGALLEVAAGTLILRQSRRGEPPVRPYTPPLQSALVSGLVLGGLLTLALLAAFMRPSIAWFDSPPGTAQAAQHQTAYQLGDRIQLLGYDLNGTTFRPGDRLELRLYWYAQDAIPYGYSSFVHVSTGGPPLAQADKLNPADRPTKEWTPDGYIRDDYTIILPSAMPPGTYQVFVGLYTCDTRPAGECGNGDRPPVTDADGNTIGDAVPLATVEVR
ncbi:MAG: hypothetical protein HZC41_08950 [Chloroflexi bacterium]|nr:hypothetical protein [Chloroflexota bacterium]